MVYVDEKKCVGCALCMAACPEGAISCFGAPEVAEICTGCLICVDHCPTQALAGEGPRWRDHGPHNL